MSLKQRKLIFTKQTQFFLLILSFLSTATTDAFHFYCWMNLDFTKSNLIPSQLTCIAGWLSPLLGYLFGHRGKAFGGVLGPQVKDVEFSLQRCGDQLVHVDVFPVKLHTAYLHTVRERFPAAFGSSAWVYLSVKFPLKDLSFGLCGTRLSQ